jgi:hypothetical protein
LSPVIKGGIFVKKSVCILLFCLPLLLSTGALAMKPEHVVGLGLGLPYGGVGVNYELGLNEWFAPTGGLGYYDDDTRWNVGGRFYYPGQTAKLRGRVTLLYGTNATLNNSFTGEKKALEGFSAGVGVDWRYSSHWAYSFDVFVADPDVPAGANRENNGIVIALGFSRRW